MSGFGRHKVLAARRKRQRKRQRKHQMQRRLEAFLQWERRWEMLLKRVELSLLGGLLTRLESESAYERSQAMGPWLDGRASE